MLYEIVSPMLYETPVVQDMGLFLQGVEKPLPNHDRLMRPDGEKSIDEDDHAVPYHKKKLLGLVKRLYIDHASSSKSTGPMYMRTRGVSGWTMPIEACTADVLGTRDLNSWTMAKDLIRQLKSVQSKNRGYYRLCEAFTQLKSVSFGTWDTRRWAYYRQQVKVEEHDMGFTGRRKAAHRQTDHSVGSLKPHVRTERNTCPTSAINGILNDILSGTRSIVTCYDARAVIEPNFNKRQDEGLMIVHNADIEYKYHRNTRIYASTMELYCLIRSDLRVLRFLTVGFVSLGEVDGKPVFRKTCEPIGGLKGLELEICLVPAFEGDEEQIQLARDVKDEWKRFSETLRKNDGFYEGLLKKSRSLGGASEKYYEKRAKQEVELKKYIGNIKFLVGDEIPACPCCGRRR